MADADQLRIVFRLANLGLVMPVVDLMAIEDTNRLVPPSDETRGWVRAVLEFRGLQIPVYDLAACLGLTEHAPAESGRLLVFCGSDRPWAIRADRIEGIIAAADLQPLDMPAYLFATERPPYRRVAWYRGEPLVSFEPEQLEQSLQEGG